MRDLCAISCTEEVDRRSGNKKCTQASRGRRRFERVFFFAIFWPTVAHRHYRHSKTTTTHPTWEQSKVATTASHRRHRRRLLHRRRTPRRINRIIRPRTPPGMPRSPRADTRRPRSQPVVAPAVALATGRTSRDSNGLSESAGRRSEPTTLATQRSCRTRRRIALTCSTRTDLASCPRCPGIWRNEVSK